jgi:hypothetical protein
VNIEHFKRKNNFYHVFFYFFFTHARSFVFGCCCIYCTALSLFKLASMTTDKMKVDVVEWEKENCSKNITNTNSKIQQKINISYKNLRWFNRISDNQPSNFLFFSLSRRTFRCCFPPYENWKFSITLVVICIADTLSTTQSNIQTQKKSILCTKIFNSLTFNVVLCQCRRRQRVKKNLWG